MPSLMTVIATPIWGMLSDRTGMRKPFILLGLTANTICLVAFFFLSTAGQYVVALSLSSVFICSLQPSFQAYVTQGPMKKGRASGIFLTSRSVGLSLGSFIGGLSYETAGMQQNFIVGFFSSIAGILVLFGLKEENDQNHDEPRSGITASHRSLLTDRNLVSIYFIDFLYSFGITIFSVLFSVYFVQIGGSKTLLGITNSAIYVIATTISTPVGILVDKIGTRPLLIFGNMCCSLLTGVLYLTNDPLITAAIWAIPLHPYISIASMALIAEHTDSDRRAAAMGLIITSQSFARVIGALLGGLLADFMTIRGIIPVSASILFMGGLCASRFVKQGRLQEK